MNGSTLELVGDILLYAGSFLMLLFCVYYTLHASWWRSEAGWFLFSSAAYLALVLLFLAAVIGKVIPADSDTRYWMRVFVYGLSIPFALWRISMLYRAQRAGGSTVTMRTPLDVPTRHID